MVVGLELVAGRNVYNCSSIAKVVYDCIVLYHKRLMSRFFFANSKEKMVLVAFVPGTKGTNTICMQSIFRKLVTHWQLSVCQRPSDKDTLFPAI